MLKRREKEEEEEKKKITSNNIVNTATNNYNTQKIKDKRIPLTFSKTKNNTHMREAP